MGIYFIAAGSSSKNREKSLDRGFKIEQIKDCLTPDDLRRLGQHFDQDESIYVWGANEGRSLNELKKVSSIEYVVDVKNKVIMQVFTFCFYIRTTDTALQNFIGWDYEKPKEERRPYRYVFFLKHPVRTAKTEKRYFQNAFEETNINWLVGQKWFSDSAVERALRLKSESSVEALLGIGVNYVGAIKKPYEKEKVETPIKIVKEQESILVPKRLLDIVNQVERLKARTRSMERAHEDLVVSLFKLLGYVMHEDIDFQAGRIDILISKEDKPLITIEVKADWSLSDKNTEYVQQAYNYSFQVGTRYVIVTNGDRYILYDKNVGSSYNENLVGQVTLSNLTEDGLKLLEKLEKGNLFA